MRCATIAPVLRFQPVPADAPPASDLIAAMVGEMATLYGPIDGPNMPSATPADFAPPRGTFLVGFDDAGAPVCGGGVKPLDDDTAEIKRMYVAPAARRRGLARVLLGALEDAARDLGYSTARLDTGRSRLTPGRCTSPPATARSATSTRTRSRRSGARSGSAAVRPPRRSPRPPP
jgi:GNAT superfamily N-acetyltransferase